MEFNQKIDPQNDPNILEKYTTDLTKDAKEGKLDPVIGREDEITRVIQILSRKTKNNPVLIGEPGVGKTAVVEGLAQRIVKGDIPENLKNKRILKLDMGSLMAGAMYMGDYESRVKGIVNKIKDSADQIILFIDELHLIVGAGKTGNGGGMDVSNLLKPDLARGELRAIGATTLDEYREYIEKDAALERRFQRVIVREPTITETISILRGLKERFENYHGVRIHDNALVAAVNLSNRYITDRYLPDKAIDLIDEASAKIKTELTSVPTDLDTINRKVMQLEIEKAALSKEKDEKSLLRLEENEKELVKAKNTQSNLKKQWESEKEILNKVNEFKNTIEQLKNEFEKVQASGNYNRAGEIQYSLLPAVQKKLAEYSNQQNSVILSEEVTENEIANVVSKWTGIPVLNLVESEKTKLLGLEASLRKGVKGQNEAIKVVSDAILRNRSGIKDPNKPIGSFLFLGPTGVGKTEVAKLLTIDLFDSVKKMIRFDMSEFMERQSVSKLIGAPPGYIGYNEGGRLTEAVRRNPYSVILFDEIEKAHPDVFNILLQILDDGQITDSLGKLVDFKNSIIIMTSNILGDYLLSVENVNLVDDEVVQKELLRYFKPEFLNRIDNIVKFNSLSKEVVSEIIVKMLDDLKDRIAEGNDYIINFSSNVRDNILANGYDKQFGARPIKRYIENKIENVIAKAIINEEIQKGRNYVMDYENDQFIISAAKRLN